MSRCALVTYADLEALSRRTFTSAERSSLTSLITGVEDYVAANCLDWTYEAAGTSHDYDGSGGDTLMLGRWLANLTAIDDDGSTIATTDVINRGHAIRYKDQTFREDYDNITVTGTWGWQAAANAPDDFVHMVKLICLDALTAHFDREEKSVSIGGVSQTFDWGKITRDHRIRSIWLKYTGVICL